MKNLLKFDGDCFEIYKEAVVNKYNKNVKETLSKIEDKVESQFENYTEKFGEKKLYELIPLKFDNVEKQSLISLYEYDSKIVQKIKNEILDNQIIEIQATCQYCTLNSAKGLDHYIHKDKYPEYSVNPLNLIPCCPECNSKKGIYSYKGVKSLFLNLYFDELPEIEYLRAEFDFSNSIPLVTFKLFNDNGIDDILFETITNHYVRLDLLDRMRSVSNGRITNLINSIKRSYKGNNDILKLKQFIIEEEDDNKKSYGFNHWESVLRLSLIEYDEFWEKFIINS